jgi:polysaccharide deacetylase 2 family uncharacterized protein YibQ
MGGWQSGLLALLFLLTTPTWATEESASCRPAHTKVSKIVLIIDDIGHRFDTGMAAVALPGKLNLAVLPYTPHAHNLASAAFDAGKEVMLHVPMSAMDGRPLGPGGLSTGLSEEDFRQTLVAALEEVPYARGINNHMGSELTQMPLQMGWVMEELQERELYFVDSRTIGRTVAARTAAHYEVPHLSRRIFLDNELDSEAIHYQFQLLLDEAVDKGVAVGIGHPHHVTLDYLQDALPELHCHGVELALVSEVVFEEQPETLALSEPDLNAPLRHVSLGLGYSVLPEMEDTGGQHRIGTAEQNAIHQVIEIANTP